MKQRAGIGCANSTDKRRSIRRLGRRCRLARALRSARQPRSR